MGCKLLHTLFLAGHASLLVFFWSKHLCFPYSFRFWIDALAIRMNSVLGFFHDSVTYICLETPYMFYRCNCVIYISLNSETGYSEESQIQATASIQTVKLHETWKMSVRPFKELRKLCVL